MQLFVRGQNLHTLNVDGCDSVLGIKQELALRDGIPVEDQVLLYAGRPLEDGMSLEECELFDQVTLDLGVRLLGGKVHGSLARAGKVKSQTPKVDAQEKKKKKTGRAKRRMQYNRRFVNVVQTFGRRRGPNSNAP
ncbi:FAU ubiquitin-like and ribosomal protein S30 isoform X1 [Nematostella vectensis]|uniref:FAU ubiquitin-like and ribosomal protein S30 isoform X1 n=1 Tax=Nematostella vectensis TaxID=45351 RepID=UPI002076EBD0|nr:FAU ubiquitin-like and ribosomal protein S30 isoform X1 [Nematostella vectensis]